MRRPERLVSTFIGCILLQSGVLGQNVEAVRVTTKPSDRQIELPREFIPYLSVLIHAKIAGFVQKVEVDRGVSRRGRTASGNDDCTGTQRTGGRGGSKDPCG
jgi:hypothetical protein